MQTEIVYKITQYGNFINVKPEDAVKNTRAIHSFCQFNCLRDCLVRSQGGWYKIELNGIMTFVVRALYLISYKELYYTLKD